MRWCSIVTYPVSSTPRGSRNAVTRCVEDVSNLWNPQLWRKNNIISRSRKLLLFYYCSSCYCFRARGIVSVICSVVPWQSIEPFMWDLRRRATWHADLTYLLWGTSGWWNVNNIYILSLYRWWWKTPEEQYKIFIGQVGNRKIFVTVNFIESVFRVANLFHSIQNLTAQPFAKEGPYSWEWSTVE